MHTTGRQSDERIRNYLIGILVECGEDRGRLENHSLLELIDVAAEKCLFDVGQFLYFVKTMLITHDSASDMLSEQLALSEEVRKKLMQRVGDLEETLRTSERERVVLSQRLSEAHKFPGLEELRHFLAGFACESCLDDLLCAGIYDIELLRLAARTKYGLKKAGIDVAVAALIRRHLRSA